MFKSCSAKGSVASEFPGHWRGCVSPNIAWICLKTPPNNNTTISNLVGGIPTPLNSSQDMETHKIHVPKHQPAIDSPSTGFPTGTINHQKISSTQHLQASCPPSRHRLGPRKFIRNCRNTSSYLRPNKRTQPHIHEPGSFSHHVFYIFPLNWVHLSSLVAPRNRGFRA